MISMRLLSNFVAVVVVYSAICAGYEVDESDSEFVGERVERALQPLPNNEIKTIADLSDVNHFNTVLDEILIPRVVGTPGHKKVREYIVSQLRSLNWNVELDEFEDDTPTFGRLRFANIVGKLNPNADRYLVLACHYDSKYYRESNFVGATDSAVPCAMMLNLIKVLDPCLQKVKNHTDFSLQLIFFDGEEAFRTWGPNDSIYGAKHLARKWSQEKSRNSKSRMVTSLNRIDVLVLLDLLGTPDPKFYSFFAPTHQLYSRLVSIEQALASTNQLKQYSNGHPQQAYFSQRSTYSNVEDDHLPFLQRGVPVLHIIPLPFPDVWHKPEDNRQAIDMNTVENLNKIFRVFVAEYLRLSV